MSIWGKVIGGVAGFAIGGPFGALLGAYAGHAVDRARERAGGATATATATATADRQVAFTMAVIVLGAKMAKADGRVTRDEIAAFRQIFHIPPAEMKEVGKLFNAAAEDATGFEPYARQIADMFAHEPAVLEELLGGLFHIAKADGTVHTGELEYLRQVGAILGFEGHAFESIRAQHMGAAAADPYEVLGLTRDATDAEVKTAYRKRSREYHPDTLIAQGLPQEFIDLATEKMAAINTAHDRIGKERRPR
ncbi:MAG: TerB family tellurite resistance protein [Proteobacteria bacterium]|nr:TerB family tellurite resistance protein [Pseudomonadota bacterium]